MTRPVPQPDIEHDGVAVRKHRPEPGGVGLAGDLEGFGGVLIGDRVDRVQQGRLLPEVAVATEGLLLQRKLLKRDAGEPFRGF
jgi:hypothetical protein